MAPRSNNDLNKSIEERTEEASTEINLIRFSYSAASTCDLLRLRLQEKSCATFLLSSPTYATPSSCPIVSCPMSQSRRVVTRRFLAWALRMRCDLSSTYVAIACLLVKPIPKTESIADLITRIAARLRTSHPLVPVLSSPPPSPPSYFSA